MDWFQDSNALASIAYAEKSVHFMAKAALQISSSHQGETKIHILPAQVTHHTRSTLLGREHVFATGIINPLCTGYKGTHA